MLDPKLKYAIIGLGLSGISCLEFLLKKSIGQILACDNKLSSSKQKELLAKYDIQFNFLDLNAYDADIILLSPGISSTLIKTKANARIINDVELFAWYNTKPVLAVTGSNGKSTVVSLLAHLLRSLAYKPILVGNIGSPVLSALTEDYDYAILELSSFQLEQIYSLKPLVAVVLNISADHLDRHGSLEAYIKAKARIYLHAQYKLFNRDENIYAYADTDYTFGLSPNLRDKDFAFMQAEDLYFVDKNYKYCKLSGNYSEIMALNIMASLAVLKLAGINIENLSSACASFQGLAHRCQIISHEQDIVWVDDSKGTNVGATLAAINNFAHYQGKIILILGGDSKGADLSPLFLPVLNFAKALILIGRSQIELRNLFQGKIPFYLAENMRDVVRIAKNIARTGDLILLSPACSSLDMFENYIDRANQFKACFLEL